MWKNILIFVLLVTVASCGSNKTAMEASSETLSYKSLGNDMATISLQLFENNTFKFDLKSIPQPGTDEKPIIISEKGIYTSDGNWKTLNFKNPKFSLRAIFDTDFAVGTDFKVIDEENVKINAAKSSLSIWGVVCERQ